AQRSFCRDRAAASSPTARRWDKEFVHGTELLRLGRPSGRRRPGGPGLRIRRAGAGFRRAAAEGPGRASQTHPARRPPPPHPPIRQCSALTGGGAVTVLQPAPDTLIITLTGAAAAKANPFAPSVAGLEAAVEQQFEVVFPAGVVPARLTLEGRVLGLLRSEGP